MDRQGGGSRDNRMEFAAVTNQENREGKEPLSSSLTHIACDCDGNDVDTTYRMCCISVGTSTTYKVASQ